jgi:hypothetical protein
MCLLLSGRGERIRTSDLTVPNRALYQAEPRPDKSLDSRFPDQLSQTPAYQLLLLLLETSGECRTFFRVISWIKKTDPLRNAKRHEKALKLRRSGFRWRVLSRGAISSTQ